MSKLAKLIVAVVVVGGLAAGIVLLTGDKQKETTQESGETSSNSSTSEETTQESAEVVINYDSSGFKPGEVSVHSGDQITVVNESEDEIEPASDPHPTHSNNPEINFGDIEPGGSKTVTVTTTGTWGYHNHYRSEHRGTITVDF